VGLLPYLAATGVISQPIDVLDKPPGMQLFNRLDNPGVQGPAAFGQERTVGNVVGQGMLEGILRVGKQAGFVDELCRLQID
jgi:hypothetical protein